MNSNQLPALVVALLLSLSLNAAEVVVPPHPDGGRQARVHKVTLRTGNYLAYFRGWRYFDYPEYEFIYENTSMLMSIGSFEVADWGSGYSAWPGPEVRVVSTSGEGADFSAGRLFSGPPSRLHQVLLHRLGALYSDDATVVIDPPHTNDFQSALDNTSATVIRLQSGQYFQNAVINRDLVIRGEGIGKTIVSGGLLGSVFKILPGVTVSLEDMTIVDGLAPSGGGIFNDGNLTVLRCEIANNRAYQYVSGEGGGIFNRGGAKLVVRDSLIRDNIAARDGGGISSSGFNLSRLPSPGGQGTASSVLATTYSDLGGLDVPQNSQSTNELLALEAQHTDRLAAQLSSLGNPQSFFESTFVDPFTRFDKWLAFGSPVCVVSNTILSNNKVGAAAAQARVVLLTVETRLPRLLGFGGAVHNDLGLMTLQDCQVLNNEVKTELGNFGGGISSMLGALKVTNSRLNNNLLDTTTVIAMGGAVYSFASYTRISDSQLNNNRAKALFLSSGGALKNTGVSFTEVTRCTLNDNTSGGGGGIANDFYGILQLTESTVAGNGISGVISANGGGLRNEAGGQAVVKRSTISGNSVKGKAKGGGVYNECTQKKISDVPVILASTLTLQNSTISGNVVDGKGTFDIPLMAVGAGVYNGSMLLGVANTYIESCTIVSNRAFNGILTAGGGIQSTAFSELQTTASNNIPGLSLVQMANSIVAHNQPEDMRSLPPTVFTTFGYNIDSDGSGAMAALLSETILPSEAQIRTVSDARLSPLQINGGPTLTHALRPSSPAIDAGSPASFQLGDFSPSNDQRGLTRSLGGRRDVGAFESTPPIGNAESYETIEEQALVVSNAFGVLANDFGSAMKAVVRSNPPNGTLSLALDGSFTYVPQTNFTGTNHFVYQVQDLFGALSPNVTVAIRVRPRLDLMAMSPATNSVAERYTDIVLRFDEPVTTNDIQANVILTGSESGPKGFAVTASGTNATLNPESDFRIGETVTVAVKSTLTSATGSPMFSGVTNQFFIFPNRAPVPGPAEVFNIAEEGFLQVQFPQRLTVNDTDLDGDPISVQPREVVELDYIDALYWYFGDTNNVSKPFYVGSYPNGSWAVRAPVAAGNGSLNLSINGTFTYRPNTNFSGDDSFYYVLTDGRLDSVPVKVTIHVSPVDDPPVPKPDLYPLDITQVTAAEGVLANDVDVDSGTLRALLAAPPSRGSVVLETNGAFTYTLALGWSGADVFTYRVADATTTSAPVRVKIGNTAPIAVRDAYSPPLGVAFVMNNAAQGLLVNDIDPDGDTGLTAVLESTSTNATVVVNPDGTFTYTPNPGFNGADVFYYRSNDGLEPSEIGRVKIGNTRPVGSNDPSYFVFAGKTLTVPADQGVLANDSDAESDPITAQLVTTTTRGVLTLSSDGSFVYTPNPGFTGNDGFTYRVVDPVTNSAIVSVTIGVFDVLRLTDVSPARNSAQSASNSSIQLTFSVPVDGTSLPGRIAVHGSFSGRRTFSTSVSNQVVTLTPNGIFRPGELVHVSLQAGIQSTNFFRLENNVAWQFNTRAPRGGARFARSIANTNNFPTSGVALGDLNGDGRVDALVQNDQAAPQLLFNLGNGVFTNRSETLGLNWTSTIGSRPLIADFNGDGVPDILLYNGLRSGGSVGLNNGAGVFTPIPFTANTDAMRDVAVADFDGDGDMDVLAVGFQFAWLCINDGAGHLTEGTRVLVYPTEPRNFGRDLAVGDVDGDGDIDAYIASFNGDKVLLNQNDGTFVVGTDILNNRGNSSVALADLDGDSDLDVLLGPDGQQAGLVWLNDGAGHFTRSIYEISGKLAKDLVAGDFDGDGDFDAFYDDPNHAASVNDGAGRFTSTGQTFNGAGWQLGAADFDGDGDLDVMTVRGPTAIYFNQTLPLARDDFYVPNGTNPLNIPVASGVLSNDVAGDGGAYSSVLVSNALRGTVTLNANGSFVYTPNASFAGTDVFLYRLVDSGQTSSIARVKIGNTTPVAVPDTNYLVLNDAQFRALAPGVLQNDTDAENDPLSAILVSAPANGTLLLRADGSFLYTAPSNFAGLVNFSYRATDGFGTSAVTAVTLDVRTRLTLVEMTPAPNHTHALAEGNVVLRFNRALNPATVATNVFVSGNFTGPRLVTRSVSGSILTIDPASRFLPGELITVTLRSGLEGAGGERLLNPLVHQFTAEAPFSAGQFYDSGQRLGSNVSFNVALGDYDGDGDLDAVTGSRATFSGGTPIPGTAALFLWLNNGQGQFHDSGQRIGDSSTFNISRADLDGDGDLDLVADEAVWLNNGSGVFSQGQTFGTSSEVFGSAIGDLNGDARPDVVTWLSGAIAVWLNQGNGTFAQSPASVATLNFAGLSVYRLVIADVDGDGTQDILSGRLGNGSPLRLWLNDGRGILRESGLLGGEGGDFIALGDADADGDVDALVPYNTTLSKPASFLWLNRGDGLFSSNGQTNGPNGSGIGTMADADGDGDLDAILPQWNSQTFSNTSTILWNDGRGQFTPSGFRLGDSTPNPTNATLGWVLNRSVGVGDLNGDGALDLYIGVDRLQTPWANQVWFNRAALGPIEGGLALQIDDRSTALPFTNVIVRGPSNVVLTVTLDDPTKGTFSAASLAAAGFTGPVGSTFTRAAGSPTSAQAAIRQLVFVPTRNRLPFGSNEVVSFSIVGNDNSILRTNRTASVTVFSLNDGPVAVNDSGAGFTVAANQVLTTSSVLANDFDPDSADLLSIVNVNTNGLRGSLTNLGNGVFRYTPPTAFRSLRQGESTTETFTYTVRDRQSLSASATVQLRVTGVNEAPVAAIDTVRLLENSGAVVLTALMLENDSDPDAGEFTSLRIISVSTNNTRGRVQLDPTNGVAYNPTGAFTLADGVMTNDFFSYTIADTNGATSTAQVTVRVMGVDKMPVALPDFFTVSEASVMTNLTALVLANDYDPNPGQTALLAIRDVEATGTIGTVTFTNNVLTYSPDGRFESLAAGQTTNETFRYSLYNRTNAMLAHHPVPLQSLVKNAFVDVRIEVTPEGLFSLTLDGQPIYTELRLPAYTAMANGQFAFGGRTGGQWEKQEVDNVSLSLMSGVDTNVVYDFASLPAGSTLRGTAQLTNGVLQLTAPQMNQMGAWVSPVLAPSNAVAGFVATFKLRMSLPSATPADGMSFIWGTDLPPGAFGEEGAGYGLVVSFDVYDNGYVEAPAIDVRWRSGVTQAVVTATIVGLNDVPTAADDAIVVQEGQPADLTPLLLANDTDVDNGETATLAVSAVSGVMTNGVLRLVDGIVAYIPHANANLRLDESVVDSFTYTVRDAQNATSNAVATIYIVGTNTTFRPLALMHMAREAGRKVRCEFAATPRALMTLERSTNLIQWQFHSVLFAPTSGLIQFVERNILDTPVAFFRVRDIGALPPDLVSYWRADGDATDSFGTNQAVLMNGLGFVPGRLGSAFIFNGGNEHVRISAGALPVPWTASFWVRRQDATDPSAALLRDNVSALKLEQYGSGRRVGITRYGLFDATADYIVPANTWTHLVFVADGSNTRVYANGVQVATMDKTVPLPLETFSGVGGDRLRGAVDETAVFNRALSPTEIWTLFNTTRTP